MSVVLISIYGKVAEGFNATVKVTALYFDSAKFDRIEFDDKGNKFVKPTENDRIQNGESGYYYMFNMYDFITLNPYYPTYDGIKYSIDVTDGKVATISSNGLLIIYGNSSNVKVTIRSEDPSYLVSDSLWFFLKEIEKDQIIPDKPI